MHERPPLLLLFRKLHNSSLGQSNPTTQGTVPRRSWWRRRCCLSRERSASRSRSLEHPDERTSSPNQPLSAALTPPFGLCRSHSCAKFKSGNQPIEGGGDGWTRNIKKETFSRKAIGRDRHIAIRDRRTPLVAGPFCSSSCSVCVRVFTSVMGRPRVRFPFGKRKKNFPASTSLCPPKCHAVEMPSRLPSIY